MCKIIIFIVFIFASINSYSQELKDITWIENNLGNKIQVEGETIKTFSILQRMKEYKIPGVSIAIVKDGQIVYVKGFGIANSNSKTEVTVNTLFQAASISKPLAALAALKLVEQGKIELDRDVNTYLKTWKIPENKYTSEEKVTLRRLLSHSAGITVHGFPGYNQKENFPTTIDVLNGKGKSPSVIVDTIPGSTWRYSGGGYTILQQIVKEISGMELNEYMEKVIFPEIGLNESTFQQPLKGVKLSLASCAYNEKGKLYEGNWHNYPETAAAGLWTTPSDLAKYCIHIQNIQSGKIKGILSKELVFQMLTRQKNNSGLGLGLGRNGDSLLFGHDGKNAGFTNLLLAFANKGDAIVIMTNGDNGSLIIEEILRAASTFYGWNIRNYIKLKSIFLEEKDLTKFTGKYSYEISGKTYFFKSKIRKGKIVFSFRGKNEQIQLTPLGITEFIDSEEGTTIDFKLNDKGEVVGLDWDKQWKVTKIN